jgi:hypothetical protein
MLHIRTSQVSTEHIDGLYVHPSAALGLEVFYLTQVGICMSAYAEYMKQCHTQCGTPFCATNGMIIHLRLLSRRAWH